MANVAQDRMWMRRMSTEAREAEQEQWERWQREDAEDINPPCPTCGDRERAPYTGTQFPPECVEQCATCGRVFSTGTVIG